MQFLSCICLIALAVEARADCDRPALVNQHRDTATLQRLESAWTLAYLRGDTEFESCLLTPDFTEIMSNGSINHLTDELALAEKNKGKAVTAPNAPTITVHSRRRGSSLRNLLRETDRRQAPQVLFCRLLRLEKRHMARLFRPADILCNMKLLVQTEGNSVHTISSIFPEHSAHFASLAAAL